MSDDTQPDMAAFNQVYEALSPLDDDARIRVISSVTTLLGINLGGSVIKKSPYSRDETDREEEEEANPNKNSEFNDFAELYAAVEPSTQAEQALVAGYWLQVIKGQESFTSQAANSELQNLGHKIANVTRAFGTLIDTKPQQVLQVKKSGSTRQARKSYKLSKAGINLITEMLNG